MMNTNLQTQASGTGIAEQAGNGAKKSGGVFKGVLANLMATLQKHAVKADASLSKGQHVKLAEDQLPIIKKAESIESKQTILKSSALILTKTQQKGEAEPTGLLKAEGVEAVVSLSPLLMDDVANEVINVEGDESVVGLAVAQPTEKQNSLTKAMGKGQSEAAQDKAMQKGSFATTSHANNINSAKEAVFLNDKLASATQSGLEANGSKLIIEKHSDARSNFGKNQINPKADAVTNPAVNPTMNAMSQTSGLAAQGIESKQTTGAGKESGNPLTKKMTSFMGAGQQLLSKADKETLKQASVLAETRKVITAEQSQSKQLFDAKQSVAAKQLSEVSVESSKAQAGFQPVTSQRGGVIQAQSNSIFQAHLVAAGNNGQAAKAETLTADAVMQATKAQGFDMQDSEANRSRLGIDGLMVEGRDVRGSRQDFSLPAAYRSAPSFQPQSAMLEIAKSARDGIMKMELQLEPAHLGKIQVILQTDAAKQLHIHLMVDQNTSRQVLEQQLPQLRQALADQGLDLSGFTMDMGPGQQQGDSNQTNHPDAVAWRLHDDMNTSNQNQTTLGMNVATDGGLSMLI